MKESARQHRTYPRAYHGVNVYSYARPCQMKTGRARECSAFYGTGRLSSNANYSSVKIVPAPRLGWAAISLQAEPEPIRVMLLLGEEVEAARSRQPSGKYRDLLLRACLPQAAQQLGCLVPVVEGDVGSWVPAEQCPDLLLRACLPQAVQQLSHLGWFVEGDVGSWVPAEQCPDLLLRACLPQAVQQLSHGVWFIEGDVGSWVPAEQCPDLLLRACLPQAVQQLSHGVWFIEGDVGSWVPAEQRSALLLRASLQQAVQQPGHYTRIINGGVGSSAFGECGDVRPCSSFPHVG